MNHPLSLPSPPLWAGERVAEGRERGIQTGSMAPMHGTKAVGAFHEPENARLDSEGLTRFRFMVPMHGAARPKRLSMNRGGFPSTKSSEVDVREQKSEDGETGTSADPRFDLA